MASFTERAVQMTADMPPSGKTIGTHSGCFQADEAMACWLLRQLPEFAGAAVVRSRDPAVLAPLDIVVDVGGLYDPEKWRFDHHQRGFFETADGEAGAASKPDEATGRWQTKLSAAGLIYKHFGRDVVARLAGLGPEDTEVVWQEVYDSFMEGLDAIDNGVEVCEGGGRYKDGSNLTSRVARLNPRWNEESNDKDRCERFEAASAICGVEFLSVLEDVVEAWLPARIKVQSALASRDEVHASGKVILLESGGMPWRDHVYALEREMGIPRSIRFVLFKDQAGMWRVQAVTEEGTLFTNRLSLPEPWRGLRDQDLVAASGIQQCAFVHAGGFIGGNWAYEGALAMAVAALDADASEEAVGAEPV